MRSPIQHYRVSSERCTQTWVLPSPSLPVMGERARGRAAMGPPGEPRNQPEGHEEARSL